MCDNGWKEIIIYLTIADEMAPVRQTTSNLERFCELSPFLRLVGSEIMCTACDTKVYHNQKSDIQAHLNRAKHLDNEKKSKKKEQSLLSFEADTRA